jgi:hypothetical protein
MSRFAKAPILVAAVMAAACLASSSASAEKRTLFKIHQDAPALTQVDVGEAGRSHGDMLAFQAGLTAEDGSKGTMSGLLITIDLPDGDDLFEDRIGQIVFDLGDSNGLVVAGQSIYSPQAAEMNAGQPQLRAVIGGTGRYIGARGQVTTSRNKDGSYEHAFELID